MNSYEQCNASRGKVSFPVELGVPRRLTVCLSLRTMQQRSENRKPRKGEFCQRSSGSLYWVSDAKAVADNDDSIAVAAR